MATMEEYNELLRGYRESKAPFDCPKCKKVFRSFTGIDYHMKNVCTPNTPISDQPAPASQRKARPKSLKKKKASRASMRAPSPIEMSPPIHETLTWREAQEMVVVEHRGVQYRLDIKKKIPVVWDNSEPSPSTPPKLAEVTAITEITDNKQATATNETAATAATITTETKEVEETPKKSSKTGKGKHNRKSTGKNFSKNKGGHKNEIVEKKQLPVASYRVLDEDEWPVTNAPPRSDSYYRYSEPTPEEIEEQVEYDLDEQDMAWLEIMNERRSNENLPEIDPDQLEILIDRFEKESYFEQSKNGSNASGNQIMIDEDAVCCVCNDGECQNINQILFCDLCNLAVHQECYGVPYIPEGQWLCRRCLQSPSCAVDCCLCPSKNGAFKQTDDARWAHVICALWIPEVGFSNTVFLEPIDSLKRVPAARWKLQCYVCKLRHKGACIQCNRANCYTAFHVTCAQQAGLYMKMEPVTRRQQGRNGGAPQVTVKKEAFCDIHTPADASPRPNNKTLADSDDKLKKARQLLAEKRHEVPQISLPLIEKDKMREIAKQVSFPRKNMMLRRLLAYWTMKRNHRNGVPLLRRLQSTASSRKNRNDPENAHQQDRTNYWSRMRHDLERARLLSELIRKREKIKREDVRYLMTVWEIQARPLNHFMRVALDRLRKIDVGEVFHKPVSLKEAPNYYKIVKEPMDFQTMQDKIDHLKYKSFDDFEADFQLIVHNCMYYNSQASVFYNVALKMQEKGNALMRTIKRDVSRTPMDKYGQLDDDTSSALPSTSSAAGSSSSAAEGGTSGLGSIQEQIELLQEDLDIATINSRRTKKIKATLTNLKRRQNIMKRTGSNSTSQLAFDDVSDMMMSPTSTTMTDDDMSGMASPNPSDVTNTTMMGRDDVTLTGDDEAMYGGGGEDKKESSSDVTLRRNHITSEDGGESDDDDNDFRQRSTTKKRRRTRTDDEQHDDVIKSAATSSSKRGGGRNRRQHRGHDDVADDDGDESDVTAAAGIAGRRKRRTTSNTSDVSKTTSTRRRKRRAGKTTDDTDGVAGCSGGGRSRDVARSSVTSRDYESSEERCAPGSAQHSSRRHRSSSKRHRSKSIEQNNDAMLDGLNKQRMNYLSTTEDEEEDEKHENLSQLHPLDLVWAKCRGYPAYPAMLIDPEMPKSGTFHNGVPIPVPPDHVLQAGIQQNENNKMQLFLVLFFDTKRTWQWLPRNKLEDLAANHDQDQSKLNSIKKPAIRKNVNAAYQRALLHRKRVTGDDDHIMMTSHSPSNVGGMPPVGMTSSTSSDVDSGDGERATTMTVKSGGDESDAEKSD